MLSTHRVALALRATIAALLLALLAVQFVALPAITWTESREADPEWALIWPLVTVFLGIACVEVVLACTWRLLSFVDSEVTFRAEAMPWVNGIVKAMLLGCALLVFSLAPFLVIVAELDDAPGLILLTGLICLVGIALTLLMVVMRTLFERATAMQSDLETVI